MRHVVAARAVLAYGIPVGRTWEVGTVRYHRYANFISITDLTNAGKRGKKVTEAAFMSASWSDKAEMFEDVAKELPKYDDYLSALGYLNKVLKDTPDTFKLDFKQLRGIDVPPAGGTASITLVNKVDNGTLEIRTSPSEFGIKSSVEHSGPKGNKFTQDTLYYPRDKKSAPLFNNWVRANTAEAGKLDLRGLLAVFDSLGIKWDSH